MQPTKFWTPSKKVAVTILLAVIAWYFLGCNSNPDVKYNPSIARPENPEAGETTEDYLKRLYAADNDRFFDNKLPKDVEIDYLEFPVGDGNMAETVCDDTGKGCVIKFNSKYEAAQRTADTTMLHEACHVRTWTTQLEKDRPAMTPQHVWSHSRRWRSCMLAIDATGAFREINIDYYGEAN